MKRVMHFSLLMLLTVLTLLSGAKALASRQTIYDQLEAARNRPDNYCHELVERKFNPAKKTVLIIDKETFCTYLLQLNDEDSASAVFSTPNSIGRAGHETKAGAYKVSRLVQFPVWVNPDTSKIMRPYDVDEGNPLGVGAITIRQDKEGDDGKEVSMAIHGTNHDETIGRRRVSGGCIRHHNWAIRLIMQTLNKGDSVIIVDRFVNALPLSYFK